MTGYQGLHICLPNEDNLGDELAHEVVPMAFLSHGLECRFHKVDLWQLRSQNRFLDDDIEDINRDHDFVVVGAGGLLSPGLINFIFRDAISWSRLKIPLFLFGVGIIANNNHSNHYYVLGPESEAPLVKALQAASIVAVRDMRTWLTAARVIPDHREKLFLTGCPTIFYAGNGSSHSLKPTHSLALNIPFSHGVCAQYADNLLQAATFLLNSTDSVKWICHSRIENKHANEIVGQLNRKIEILYPRNLGEVREAYQSCERALVTKAHAALFCLANEVPFGFFSYDMKCDALMEMITDFPNDYMCHVESLTNTNIPGQISRLLYTLQRDTDYLKSSQRILVEKLGSEFNLFMSALKDRIS